MRRALGVATGCALLVSAVLATGASAITYAPVDQPGPALSVPQDQLDSSLQCSGSLAGASRAPVLLLPGTGSDPEEFEWNWEPRLSQLGISWCALTIPQHTLGDIQVAAEYAVNAIRTMHAQAGRRIAILGHSQGGMLPRWGFRFWPDTRQMVDDDIGLGASNHGTYSSIPTCTTMGCPESFWQQTVDSEFIKALNSYQETFPGIAYTEIYTHTDWVVTPNFDDNGSSSLHGGGGEIENEAIQEICPTDLTEHNGLVADNAAYALAIDALDHPGPADPARIDPSVCLQPLMPGVDSPEDAAAAATTAAHLLAAIGSYPPVHAEPPLRCYVTASCGGGQIFSQSGATPKSKVQGKCRRKHKRAKRAEASKRAKCKKKHRKK